MSSYPPGVTGSEWQIVGGPGPFDPHHRWVASACTLDGTYVGMVPPTGPETRLVWGVEDRSDDGFWMPVGTGRYEDALEAECRLNARRRWHCVDESGFCSVCGDVIVAPGDRVEIVRNGDGHVVQMWSSDEFF